MNSSDEKKDTFKIFMINKSGQHDYIEELLDDGCPCLSGEDSSIGMLFFGREKTAYITYMLNVRWSNSGEIYKFEPAFDVVDSNEINRIDIKEFREKGFLQEANRLFFHPLGLALEIIINEDGSERLGGVWDYREDSEGMSFGEGMISEEKIKNIEMLKSSKRETRTKLFGSEVQPL